MSGRVNQRWTPPRLERCRALFEGGAALAEIGAKFGIAPSTVSVMAWQNKWQRRVKPPVQRVQVSEQVASADGDDADTMLVTPHEHDFNRDLRQTIKAYWRERGRDIWLDVVSQGGGVLGIRSRSRNGVPVKG